MESKRWYVANGDKAEGPYTENELKQLFTKDLISNNTYIVDAFTMNDWKQYSECFPVNTLPKIPNMPPIPGANTKKSNDISENKPTKKIPSPNNKDIAEKMPSNTQQNLANNSISLNNEPKSEPKSNNQFSSQGRFGIITSIFSIIMMFMPVMRVRGMESYGDMLGIAEKITDAEIGVIASHFPYIIFGLHILALFIFLFSNRYRSCASLLQTMAGMLFLAFCVISRRVIAELIPTIQGILCAIGFFITANCYRADIRIRKKQAKQ